MSLCRTPLFVSLIVLAVSASAFAGPKVGDTVVMDGTLVGDGINAKASTVQKITAYNANTGVYTVAQTTTIATQSQTKETQVAADDMLTEENGALIVAYCESQGIGKKERISVSAGTFDTCRVTNSNGSLIWVAPVPFGVVKLQSKISVGTITLGASGITRGQ